MKYEITTGADTAAGIKVVIYGVEGVGKTTLASKFPDPLFIDTEGSTTHFENIRRLPKPKDWADLRNMIEWVGKEKPCKTLVIDTFDWAESEQITAMLKEEGWTSISSPGYGIGYIQSAERIQRFLDWLKTTLIDVGINVILNCHAQTVKFEVPEEAGSYNKYELKLGAKTQSRTSPLVREWADLMLFCNYKTRVESCDSGKSKYKATGGQERYMYSQHSAVWDAKNRFGLPEEMPMDYKYLRHIFDKKEKPEPKLEKEPEPEPDPGPVKEPGYFTWPECVPKPVVEVCIENALRPDDVQQMLFMEGIVDEQRYPLEKIPMKFWNSLANDFDRRWKEKAEKAREANLPF